jgi:hypothetical protein
MSTISRTIIPLLLLCGCSTLQIDPVDSVVREAASLARANSAEQKSVLAGAQKAFIDDPSTPNRLRLATLLATVGTPLRDDARAGELLEPMADPNGSSTGRFAAFVAAQVTERQRVSREVDRLTKERSGMERDLKERDKREEALKQQLDALRAIERGILDREDRMRRRPGAR